MKKMKIKKFETKKLFKLKLYIKGKFFCANKNKILLDQDELDQFFAELNDGKDFMEFGGFYFRKEFLTHVKTKVVKIKVKE